MNSKKYVYSIMALAVLATLAAVSPVLAQTTTPTSQPNTAWKGRMHGGGVNGAMKPAVFGTVSAISGNTITVAGKQGFGTTATTATFTVDATNAKIMKNNVAGTISSIAVGDTIVAQGTLTGTNIVATTIRDGIMTRGGAPGKMNKVQTTQTNPVITGNGEPVIAGTVSSISGSTLMITNKSNVNYTVDVTNAKISNNSNTIVSVSNIAVGDMVIVQGTVNVNSVVASSVIDQAKPASSTTTAPGTAGQSHQGFFGSIGSFFSRIFGF